MYYAQTENNCTFLVLPSTFYLYYSVHNIHVHQHIKFEEVVLHMLRAGWTQQNTHKVNIQTYC